MSSTPQASTRTAGTDTLSTVERATIALLTFTAVTHLYAGAVEGAPPVFVAGLGFLGGIALYLRGTRQYALTLAAIPFTAVQIPLWYVAKAGSYTTVGYLDKAAQVLLLVALVLLAKRRRSG